MRKFVRFLIWLALIAGLAIGIARATALRWWRVPQNDPYLEASVLPTLQGGDLIILWRATRPGFGDLVICPEPKAPERIVIGRIVGEGGDHIRIKEANVWINSKRADTERSCDQSQFTAFDPSTKREVQQRCQEEVLGSGTHKRGNIDAERIQPPDYETNVPRDHVFLVSDNRLFPYDSREFGPVLRETCKESIVFRLVSRAGFFDVENRFTFIH